MVGVAWYVSTLNNQVRAFFSEKKKEKKRRKNKMPVAIESVEANAPTTNIGSSIENGIVNAATGGVGGLVGEGISAIGNAIFGKTQADKDQEQLTQQGKLDQQQLGYNEQQTDYGEQTQQKLWNGTNSIALADEAAKEGYNAALIYGGGGGGGSTGSGSASINAPQAPNSAEQTQAQVAQQNAETNTANAATTKEAVDQNVKNQEAQIPNINADTQQKIAQASNIIQATGNLVLEAQFKTLMNQMQTMQNEVMTYSMDDLEGSADAQYAQLQQQVQKTILEVSESSVSNSIMHATKETVIETYNAQLQQIMSNTLQNKAGANLDNVTADNVAKKTTTRV